jgi:hypothetical protein
VGIIRTRTNLDFSAAGCSELSGVRNSGILKAAELLRVRASYSTWTLAALLCFFPLLHSQNKTQQSVTRVPIPETTGWHEIPDTKLASRCANDPAVEGNSGCRAVINAWNGGVADEKRDRLILWGGGHSDYYGNEVYALDMSKSTLSRLTEPSPVTNVMSCPEAYTDGRPSARHTYGGLAYLAEQDSMFIYGGSKSACGFMSAGSWAFDLGRMEWKNLDPHQGDSPANNPGAIAEYDSNTGTVMLSDTANLFRYDPVKNSYKRVRTLSGVDYRLSGVIDPDRKLFFMIGGPGQFWAIGIGENSKFEVQDWSRKVTGCDPLRYTNSPGLAYDAARREIVGWSGGDTVYLFQPETRTCSAETYPGGPGPAQPNGTFGRFQYYSRLGVFALVNDWKQNAFLLRLAPRTKSIATPVPQGNN